MELASNLVWMLVSGALLASVWRAARAGRLRTGRMQAFALAGLLCMLLLPIISLSDDALEARQRQLPISAQTWHLATHEIATTLDIVPVLFACLVLLQHFARVVLAKPTLDPFVDRSRWIVRGLRLRPPPALAL